MGKIHVINGWYSSNIFKVEPQVVWLTASEIGINIWLKRINLEQTFKTGFCIDNSETIYKSQTIGKGQGIFTFGPLTEVFDINNLPSNNRWVTVKIYGEKIYKNKKHKKYTILNLKYKIPDYWPTPDITVGSKTPPFRLVIGSCLRLPED